jgi:hypothetical protein
MNIIPTHKPKILNIPFGDMAASSEVTEKSTPNRKVTGVWFDVCKCNVPCPSTFNQAPSYGVLEAQSMNQLNLKWQMTFLIGVQTPADKRVHTINALGREVGPGTVATWEKVITNEVDALSFKWQWNNRSSKRVTFN